MSDASVRFESPDDSSSVVVDIDLSDYNTLLDDADKELATIKEAESRAEKARPLETPDITEDEIAAKFSADLHDGVEFRLVDLPADRLTYEKYYCEVKPIIFQATEEIRKALEYKSAFAERNLRKGRLDSGALWKIRVNDNHLFQRINQPGDMPTLSIYLLVDCSGSMEANSNMYNARLAAILLYEVCAALKIPVNVTGFTGDIDSYRDVVHFRAVKFGASPEAKYAIAKLKAMSQNRDGYSIRVTTKELLIRPETHKVLIVLSDGLPLMPYLSYTGKSAVIDTAKAVREAEKQDIRVIGLFFGDEWHISQAQKIYNNLIFVRTVSTLPRLIGRVLKKVITGL